MAKAKMVDAMLLGGCRVARKQKTLSRFRAHYFGVRPYRVVDLDILIFTLAMVQHPLFGANPVHETRVLKSLTDVRMVRTDVGFTTLRKTASCLANCFLPKKKILSLALSGDLVAIELVKYQYQVKSSRAEGTEKGDAHPGDVGPHPLPSQVKPSPAAPAPRSSKCRSPKSLGRP